MKGKTRRKIKKFSQAYFTYYGSVFTIGGLIAVILLQLVHPAVAYWLPFPVWVWLKVHWLLTYWFTVLVTLYLISSVLFSRYKKSLTPEINYFEPINFGKPDENTILKAIDGILNSEKVAAFYVHAAPKSKKVETVYLRLKKTGFAIIFGGSGEGKSMIAYHTVHRFQEKDRYHSYRLRVELLEDKMGEELADEVLSHLDSLKEKKKLIVVDDAHRLAMKQDTYIHLQQEAKERHGKYIWIETEFYEEKRKQIQSSGYTQVDFQSFLEDLLKNLYKSQDPTLQKALEGRIEGLSDAITRAREGKIRDPWQFAFVASRGEERLAQEIEYLSKLELLVLFIISAHTILSGESELHINFVQEKVNKLSFGWLAEDLRKSSVSDAIKSLQEQTYERKSMIRIYDKSENDRGYIASLHYNWARAVIRASRLRTNLINDLLSSMKELLMSEYRKCVYIGVFHRDIRPYAADFDRENKEWLITFLNNLLTDKLGCYAFLLQDVKRVATDIYDEIIRKLDIDRISEKVSGAEAGQFQNMANLLHALGDRQNDLIDKLDLVRLAKTASGAEVGQFDQLAYLLSALGKHGDKLIKNLDLVQLAQKASGAEVGQFQQIAHLLNALGEHRDKLTKKLHRDKLIEKLDLVQLTKTASRAEVGQFAQLQALISALEDHWDDRTNSTSADSLIAELIRCPDFTKLTEKASRADVGRFDQLAYLLNALGKHGDTLIRNLDLVQLAQKASGAEVGQFAQLQALISALEDHWDDLTNSTSADNLIGELIRCPDFTKLTDKVNRADVKQFQQIAQFLNALGEHRDKLVEKLDYNTLSQEANQVDPSDISALSGLTLFIAQLDDKRCDEFISKIQWLSICKGCPISTNFIPALGSSLENLLKQAEILSDSAGVDDLAKHLRAHISEIKQCIRETHFLQYRGLARFLWNCNQVNHQLAIEISDADTIYELINSLSVFPCNYRGVGELINALFSIDPRLSKFFIKKVYVTITRSINKRDWSKEEEEDLKHLIKAFYRSAPDFWKRIMANRNLITVDLSSLALDTIYKEADEEKKAGAAYNTP